MFADLVELGEGGCEKRLFDPRVVDRHDFAHRVDVWEPDVMEKTTTQESIGQFFFIVGCDDHDRSVDGFDCLAGFVDVKFHPIKFLQKVIWEFDVCLVDLINQQDGFAIGAKRLPQLALFDVVGHVVYAFVAQLAVT